MSQIQISNEIRQNDIVRRTVYLFKQFARKNGFWEEYKKLSILLNKNKKPFIEIVSIAEPIQLIQSTYYFCAWPSLSTINWSKLSFEWSKICIENNLWHNKHLSIGFGQSFISGFSEYYKTIKDTLD